jgi:hypothetical protein
MKFVITPLFAEKACKAAKKSSQIEGYKSNMTQEKKKEITSLVNKLCL